MLSAIIMLVLPLLAHMGGGAGFWSCFCLLVVFGIINGINQASIFQLAGGLPPHYIGALIIGPGISGVASNVVRALTLIFWPVDAEPDNAFKGAIVFYVWCSVMMVICGMLMFILTKNEFAIYHLWQFEGFTPAGYTPLSPVSATEASPVKMSKKPAIVEHVTLDTLVDGIKQNLSTT